MEGDYKRETIMVYDLGRSAKRLIQKPSMFLNDSPGNYRIVQTKPEYIIIDNPNILIDDLEIYFNLLSADLSTTKLTIDLRIAIIIKQLSYDLWCKLARVRNIDWCYIIGESFSRYSDATIQKLSIDELKRIPFIFLDVMFFQYIYDLALLPPNTHDEILITICIDEKNRNLISTLWDGYECNYYKWNLIRQIHIPENLIETYTKLSFAELLIKYRIFNEPINIIFDNTQDDTNHTIDLAYGYACKCPLFEKCLTSSMKEGKTRQIINSYHAKIEDIKTYIAYLKSKHISHI